MTPKILVLDADPEGLKTCRELELLGYKAFSTSDPEKAYAFVKTDRPAVVFCNIIALASRDSRLLYTIRTLDAALPVIILTSLATIEAAAAALREGALFYLLMPLTLDDLKPAVERALSYRQDPWEPVFG
jgi:DNA-binding NtrC family response regulator